MIENYVRAFGADLNAYYPGVNALGLLQAQVALAEALPEDWSQIFDSDAQALHFLSIVAPRSSVADSGQAGRAIRAQHCSAQVVDPTLHLVR